MAMYRKKPATEVEAHKLGPGLDEQNETIRWVVANGYPWLLGDPARPSEMAPKGGKPGDPGIRVDEQWGELVIHTGVMAFHAAVGDYLVRYPEGHIVPLKPGFFETLFEEVG